MYGAFSSMLNKEIRMEERLTPGNVREKERMS